MISGVGSAEEGVEKTGVMTVKSGRWLPPATGLLARMTSPGFSPPGPNRSSWYLMANDIDPEQVECEGYKKNGGVEVEER